MKEIIDSILQAEEMAEQIISEAEEFSRQAIIKRNTDGEKAKANAIATFGAEKKETLINAEIKATKEYDKIMAKAQLEVEKMVESANSRIDELAQEIVDGLIK